MTVSDAGPFHNPVAASGRPAVKDRHSRLEELVNYDELTGHFNRTRLREAVDRPVAAAFLAVGIDNMRALNETLGRAAADTVLIEVGRAAKRFVESAHVVD